MDASLRNRVYPHGELIHLFPAENKMFSAQAASGHSLVPRQLNQVEKLRWLTSAR